MGYRSDVRVVTSNKGFKKLKEIYNKKMIDNDCKYNLLEHLDIDHNTNDNNKYFGWNYTKWYYKDVELFEESLNELEEQGYSYNFARIGESYEDIDSISIEGKKEGCIDDYPLIDRSFDDDEYIYSKASEELEM